MLYFMLQSWLLALLVLLAACRQPNTPPVLRHAKATIERLDERLDALLDLQAQVEILAEGFLWAEGPVWVPQDTALLFSDIPRNTVYRWTNQHGLAVYLRPAGYVAGENPPGRELGVNGLALDPQGRLVMADHGLRQISRLNPDQFTKTALAQRYQGRRLNSPNDLVFRRNGALFFTDPPYGLEGLNASPLKELPFNGVYRLDLDGTLTLLLDSLRFPNGIALSPDENVLYVSQSDPAAPRWYTYHLNEAGDIIGGHVLFNAQALMTENRPGLPDGMAIDARGNLFATGPGGVLILTPDGEHLGTIRLDRAAANCAFGDDGYSLYITATDQLLRIRTRTRGKGF
jgi:gluconolactonase